MKNKIYQEHKKRLKKECETYQNLCEEEKFFAIFNKILILAGRLGTKISNSKILRFFLYFLISQDPKS